MYRIALFTLVFLNLAAGNLRAGSITVTDVDWQRFGLINLKIDGSAIDEYAGAILGNFNGGPTFTLFCVDLFTNISLGTYDSTTVAPRVARNEGRAAWLYVNAFDPAVVNTPALGEALQVAIWDIVHDGGDGPNAGRIQASINTPLDVVQSWGQFLVNSEGQSSVNASIYLNSLGIVSYQTLIGVLQPGQNPPTDTNVPEPGSLGLMAIGCGSIAVAQFVRRRRVSSSLR